jgi:hypothetical protein
MYAQPLMRFDQDTQSWRTSLDTSLWDLPMSSVTLPASGLMRNGELFERPMLERPTNATGSLSLPTPKATNNENQPSPGYDNLSSILQDHVEPRLKLLGQREATVTQPPQSLFPTPRAQARQDIYNREDYHYNLEEALATLPTPLAGSMGRNRQNPSQLGVDEVILSLSVTTPTLPTPTARDHKDTTVRMEPHRPNDIDTINRALAHLMPTPTVMDMGSNYTPEEWTAWKDEQRAKHNNGNGHGESLTQAAIAWGKYEPAIRRWENLTREVPEATVPHKEKRRLNPAFVEWMMGLPAGHVTGHGLSAAKELKMLGNGVVPQQAAAAIGALMSRSLCSGAN